MPPELLIWPNMVSLDTGFWSFDFEKSNQFIFVPNYIEIVNLVKLPQAAYQISCSQTSSESICTHGRTQGRPENRKPSPADCRRRHKNQ